MSSVEISVVMCVYNNADTLAAATDSILAQEGVKLEFIIVDDGSTDACPAMLDEYARQYSQVRIIHQANKGLTRALINGCELATAPWIARQDADDVSLPGRLSALRDLAIKHPDAAILGSSTRYIGPEGEHLIDLICTTDMELSRRQIRELGIGPPAHGCVMFSREIYMQVGGYRACFYYGQDADLWMRMADIGSVVYTDAILYAYRLSPGAISGANRTFQKTFGRLGQLCRNARRQNRCEDPYLREAEEVCRMVKQVKKEPASVRDRWVSYYHIGSLLQHKDRVKAAEYFRRAVTCNPLAWRPRLKLIMNRLGR